MPWDMFSPNPARTSECRLISNPSWNSFALSPRLAGDEIHIWRARLDLAQDQIETFSAYLSPDEKERARRYKFETDRNRFICCRGILRAIVSRYLDVEPVQIEFEYGTYGKPGVKMSAAEKVLNFNLSHSHGLALYGVAWNREIGIDLEYVRPVMDADGVVGRYFSTEERAFYQSVSPEKKREEFFNLWTVKEACLKAVGLGLSHLPNRLELPAVKDSSAPLETEGFFSKNCSWSLYRLRPKSTYVAAIAFAPPGSRFGFWKFSC
ncbi:MAG: 4'-phosphopantetheinyl transferase superfamily protein [Deltaproteobacteria bacterium]|nr:4'-phosphopantetheinyl transferase superfamily protein [Deltaproteobacteria bacterium]